MVVDQQARDDFERALVKAFWRRVVTWLKGESNELLPFDEIREVMPMKGQHYLGYQQVPINTIIGSQGRYRDFDRAFLPIQSQTKGRWVSIDKAHYEDVRLPPVELFKMGEVYFVKDGNHRVSVAREQGQEFMDAYVTEIDIPVPLTTDTRVNDISVKREYATFLEETKMDTLHPDSDFSTINSGQYKRLLEHIEFHHYLLAEQEGVEVSYEDAVVSWYENVYLPVVKIIREHNLTDEFKGATELDLYLWIIKYQWYLRLAYKKDDGVAQQSAKSAKREAARQVVEEEHQPAVKKLIKILKKADWIDRQVFEGEREAFYKRTQLREFRPDADIRTSVLGQYDKLLEHISVHRWYLGEQRIGDVSFADAAVSWYDKVYIPLISIIREQKILEEFPERTEADLYLWVIARQAYLQATFGSEVTIQQVTETLSEKDQKNKSGEQVID
jgi:hypothetical protein